MAMLNNQRVIYIYIYIYLSEWRIMGGEGVHIVETRVCFALSA